MATRPRKVATPSPDDNVTDYRYPAKRKNNPPAGRRFFGDRHDNQ